MDPLAVLDIGLRGAAVALLLFLAALLLRDGWRVRPARYAAIFVLSSIGFAVSSAPDLQQHLTPWLVPFHIGRFGDPALLWPLSAVIFDDEFRPSWRHAAVWLVVVALGFACLTVHEPVVGLASMLVNVACVGLAAWHAVAGRAGDLVEGRRRLRAVFVLAIGFSALADTVTELVMNGQPQPLPVDLTRLVLLLVVVVGSGLALLGVLSDGPLLSLLLPRQAVPAVDPPSTPPSEAADKATLAALDDLMERQRCYREEGLTIAALAARLGLPEYRLRRLINQGLDYRNFAEFLNRYRLQDTTAALADPAQEAVPILTIALDAGFGSIGPFNRAFKAQTGLTPTEFRRARLAEAAARRAVSAIAESGIALPVSETGEKASVIPITLLRQRRAVRPPA